MNYRQIAKLHIAALPHTSSSRRGVEFVAKLYHIVRRIGYVKTVKREGEMVGVVSGISRWILTLAVDPARQRRGIGKELLAMIPGRRYVYTEECTVGFYEKQGFAQIIRWGKVTFLCRK
jgi:GNAT superfamily N-acetyltransferase